MKSSISLGGDDTPQRVEKKTPQKEITEKQEPVKSPTNTIVKRGGVMSSSISLGNDEPSADITTESPTRATHEVTSIVEGPVSSELPSTEYNNVPTSNEVR